MKVAILGASGFTGRNLLLNLPKDWQIYAFFNTDKTFQDWVIKKNIKVIPIKVNLSDTFIILGKDIPNHFDLVISLIGNTQRVAIEEQPLYDFNADTFAISNFFSNFTCDKCIYFSSGAVYENHVGLVSVDKTKGLKPTMSYPIAKLTSEYIISHFHWRNRINQYLIVRFFGAYGPYQKNNKIVLSTIKKLFIDKEKELNFTGTGKNLFDAMYVQDAIDWILLAVQKEFKNQTIDFGLAKPITIKQLIKSIAKACDRKDVVINFDGLPPKEDYYFRLGDENFTVLPPFGYKFKVSLEKGLVLTRDWILKNVDILWPKN